jgi:hypothetical protein
MNDLEQDLKELFDRKMAEVRLAPVAPQRVLERTRRRQVATVGLSTVVVVAVALGSLIGARSLLDRSSGVPAGEDERVSRTVSGVTISYPEDWHFEAFEPVARRQVGGDVEVQSSNVPLFGVASFVPPASIISMTGQDLCEADGVVLAVGSDEPRRQRGFRDPWPVPLRPASQEEAGTCSVLQATWTAGGATYQAAALIGPDAPGGDVDLLVAVFEGMTFEPTELPSPVESPTEPASPVPSSESSPADGVTVKGEDFGVAWELLFTNEDGSVCVALETEHSGIGMCAAEPVGGHTEPPPIEHGEFELGDGSVMVAGSVSAETASVAAELEEGGTVDAQMVDLSALGVDPPRRGFHVELPGNRDGWLVARDGDGNETDRVPFGRPSGTSDELPQPVPVEHGGTYWAVYLGVAEGGSPELDAAMEFARRLGVKAGSGDLACDQGAAEVLGVPADWQGVGVYFATREDAERFYIGSGLSDLDAEPLIARVTTFCLD